MGFMDPDRFQRAINAIDAANAGDPNRICVRGVERPKEQAHAELVTEWVKKLRPEAGEELLLAARGHHIRRWTIPRESYPAGRIGYLNWRNAQKAMHAATLGEILAAEGYPAGFIRRVKEIVRKVDIKGDPDVQALEDALCLVFLETQFAEVAQKLDRAKMVDVVRKTLPKMSEEGRRLALTLPLAPEMLSIIREAAGG